MPTLQSKKLARCLQIVTFVLPIIALAWLLSSESQNARPAVAAGPLVAQDAEKKVTINGVDSTRIDYELDDESATPGVFKSDATDDDKDIATNSKITRVRVLRQDGTVFPGAERDCTSQNCTIVVNTNRGNITVKDSGTNAVELTYGQRQTYRYSCQRRAVHSRRVHVQSVRLSGPDLTITCPGNKCSAEVTYNAREAQKAR
ncbi:MAG: hypothetical protein ABI882_18240 [Acidobacteriota bacterium]